VARVADRYGEAVARRRVNLRCGSGHRCLPWRRCGRAPSTSPTRRSLLSITGRYAIALYPYLNRLTDATADPQQIISMIIALHSTTPDIADLTPIDDLRIRNRPTKCAASMPAEPLGASSQRHRVLPALLGSTPASRRRTPRRSCSAEKAADGSDREAPHHGVHAAVGAQNAFVAAFHSRRRWAMSWARSSALPPSSTWRSEGSARR
jgi:hypothetical protein